MFLPVPDQAAVRAGVDRVVRASAVLVRVAKIQHALVRHAHDRSFAVRRGQAEVCKQENASLFFLSAFSMFVQSLSWENDKFRIKWHRKRGAFSYLGR